MSRRIGFWFIFQLQPILIQNKQIIKNNNNEKIFIEFCAGDLIYIMYVCCFEFHKLDLIASLKFIVFKLNTCLCMLKRVAFCYYKSLY